MKFDDEVEQQTMTGADAYAVSILASLSPDFHGTNVHRGGSIQFLTGSESWPIRFQDLARIHRICYKIHTVSVPDSEGRQDLQKGYKHDSKSFHTSNSSIDTFT